LAAANSELEAFSYSVSHDLRAPLRQVAGFVGRMQKLNKSGADPGAAEQYLPLIEHSVARMGRLIDDLLEFSRIGRAELHFQNVSLRSLLEQTLQAAEPDVAERPIHWTIDTLPEVRGDAAMLRQVFANLIDNAVKFARTRDPAEIVVGTLPADSEHVVFVRDNGVGFDPKYAHKLFGVFQRLHSTAEFDGTGIGLATVRRIIERHGGRTWAEGALNQGATISFSLPH
jgi:light-regulated signal transduction histidine kinase (bacteriophytochrome)